MQADKRRLTIRCALIAIASACAGGALAAGERSPASETMIYDFEDGVVPDGITGGNAELEVVTVPGGKALRADLASRDNFYTSVTIKPRVPMDLSGSDVVGIAMDIRNTSDASVQLNLDVVDSKGRSQTRSTAVPALGGGTYFADSPVLPSPAKRGCAMIRRTGPIPGASFTGCGGRSSLTYRASSS